jgi:multidrug transporter EmrE-like cation transporter
MFNQWNILAALASASTIIFVKLFDSNKQSIFFILAILAQAILLFTYIQLLQFQNLVLLYTISKIIAILLVTFFGYVFFNYKLTLHQFIGICLGIIALFLLQ